MKAKNLLCVAQPLILLGGCATDKAEIKANSFNKSELKIDKPSTS